MSPCDQCLVTGHRGFKGKYTENTINGFEKCYETGATIFETDVWTSKDEVLVISHDVNTKRVFCDENGNETNYNILETYYADLKPLRTIGSGEPLMTFRFLLEWFFSYVKEGGNGAAECKISLDLKNANPPKLLRLLMEDIVAVHSDLSWWFPRIQIGVWNLRFVKYLNQDPYFQDLFRDIPPFRDYTSFDLFHISLSWEDSTMFLAYNEYLDALPKDRFKWKVSGVSLIHVSTWSSGFLTKFMPAMKAQNLKLYSWTINTVSQLRYLCTVASTWKLKEYGVISDYPDKMMEALATESWPYTGEVARPSSFEDIRIPSKFKFAHWLVKITMYFLKPVQFSNSSQFSARVDPEEKLLVKRSIGIKIFALLQKWGVF